MVHVLWLIQSRSVASPGSPSTSGAARSRFLLRVASDPSKGAPAHARDVCSSDWSCQPMRWTHRDATLRCGCENRLLTAVTGRYNSASGNEQPALTKDVPRGLDHAHLSGGTPSCASWGGWILQSFRNPALLAKMGADPPIAVRWPLHPRHRCGLERGRVRAWLPLPTRAQQGRRVRRGARRSSRPCGRRSV